MPSAIVEQSTDAVLGSDFLTWLWYKSDAEPDGFRDASGAPFHIFMEHSVVVQGGEGELRDTASVSGAFSPLREARFGLAAGKKVTRAALRVEQDDLIWRFSLRAEDFSVSACRLPKTERDGADDEPDAALLERVFLLERCMALLDGLYGIFLRARLAPQWPEEASRVSRWILGHA
jgi:hypothetical protein